MPNRLLVATALLSIVAERASGAAAATPTTTCPYAGGWSLRIASLCPPAAPVSCGTGLQNRCCPSGFECAGTGAYNSNYCCRPGENCQAQASATPQCPDPAWSLWGVDGVVDQGGWCCMPGAVGAYQNDTTLGSWFGVACYSGSSPLPTKLGLAGRVVTASCVPPLPSSTSVSSFSAPTAYASSLFSGTLATSMTAGTSTTAGRLGPAVTYTDLSNDSGGTDGEGGSRAPGLSTGGIAGTVAGCVAGLALLLAAGAFLVRRRGRKRAATETMPAVPVEVREAKFFRAAHHPDSGRWSEAPNDSGIYELPDTSRHELSNEPPTPDEHGDIEPQVARHESDDTISPVTPTTARRQEPWRLSID